MSSLIWCILRTTLSGSIRRDIGVSGCGVLWWGVSMKALKTFFYIALVSEGALEDTLHNG